MAVQKFGSEWKDLLNKRETARDLRMPNLIGVGAARSGTTSLYHIFKKHPEILVSPVKELVYFSHKILEVNPRGWSPEEYMLFFSEWQDEAWAAEISPHYLHAPAVPQRIFQANPDARVIIQFREPIARLKSHFRKHAEFHKYTRIEDYVRHGLEHLKSDKPVGKWFHPTNNLRQSFYAEAMQRYLDVFGEDRVAVIHLDHMNSFPDAFSEMLTAFLGVETPIVADARLNAADDVLGSGSLSSHTLEELKELYEEDYRAALELYASLRHTPMRFGAEPISI